MITARDTDYQARLGFHQQPSQDDFVYYSSESDLPRYESVFVYQQRHEAIGNMVDMAMAEAIEMAGDIYGIRFDPLGSLERDKPQLPYKLFGTYALSAPGSLADLDTQANTMRRRLPTNSKIVFASYYDAAQPPDGHAIQEVSEKYDIHVPHADEPHGDFKVVTASDILDSIVCETFRHKYRATPDGSHEALLRYREGLQSHELRDTVHYLTQEVFAKHRLYHRGPTDGAYVINSDYGSFVTQAKTDKSHILTQNLSLVTGAEASNNEISYVGEKLPSSDAPELIEVVRLLGEAGRAAPKLLVHFHHPTLTRSGLFPNNETAEEIEYGQFASGQKIFDELQAKQTNWLVLKNHGFLWLGDSPEDLEKFVVKLEQLEAVSQSLAS